MIPNVQQYQSPDGSYLSEVNAILQDTGNVLASDPVNKVPAPLITLSNSSNEMSHRGHQVGVTPNLRI